MIGAGYLGSVTGVCLAKLGHDIIFVDKDKRKLTQIRQKKPPVFEPGLDELLMQVEVGVEEDLQRAVRNTDICFVCVGTPNNELNGHIDLTEVRRTSEEIGKAIGRNQLVVIKSTVMPGAMEKEIIPILEKNGKKLGTDFGVCVNPEFLREGTAINDFLHPDRIIIGEANTESGDCLSNLYREFDCPILRVDLKTAEMIKLASNCFLATKISFINELGNICKLMGIDVYKVATGMAYDPRIGDKFLSAGIGFGGSCLPKDLAGLITMARDEVNYQPKLLQSVMSVNNSQPLRAIELLKKYIPNLDGQHIGVLGLAFKPGTDDVRDSPAIKVIKELLAQKAIPEAYDPRAMTNFRTLFPQIEYRELKDVMKCRAIMIITEWAEFVELDYKGKIVIDGRRLAKANGAEIYEGVCW